MLSVSRNQYYAPADGACCTRTGMPPFLSNLLTLRVAALGSRTDKGPGKMLLLAPQFSCWNVCQFCCLAVVLARPMSQPRPASHRLWPG